MDSLYSTDAAAIVVLRRRDSPIGCGCLVLPPVSFTALGDYIGLKSNWMEIHHFPLSGLIRAGELSIYFG
jgi:hypothetical protein